MYNRNIWKSIYSLPDNMNKWHVLHRPTFTASTLMVDNSRITVHWAEMLLFLFSAWQAHCKISIIFHPRHPSFSIKHKNPSKVPETSLEVAYWLFKSTFCTTWAYFFGIMMGTEYFNISLIEDFYLRDLCFCCRYWNCFFLFNKRFVSLEGLENSSLKFCSLQKTN